MKTPSLPQKQSDIVDQIVEDLAQQDVLPVGSGEELMTTDEALLTADEQAGRWDDPVGAHGHQAARIPLEDETKSSEVLVERGAAEAAEELQDLEEEEAPDDETEE